MTLQINVVGYYNHENAGDEQYKRSFDILFKQYLTSPYTLTFIDCDTLDNHDFNENDLIIFGGGDVLNEYFVDKLIKKFSGSKNKIIAVSVGAPFLSFLKTTNKLSIVDYFFIRTLQDYDLFCEYFTADKVFYMPDLSILLPSISLIETSNPIVSKLQDIRKAGKEIVTFALSTSISNDSYPNEYANVRDNLIIFTRQLISSGYHIVFVPFNVNSNTMGENDTVIHNDIAKELLNTESLTVFETKFTEDNLFDIFEHSSYVIPMRLSLIHI